MKGKYITAQVLLAAWSRPARPKDIHAALAETIAERKRILENLESITRKARVIELYLGNNNQAA
jgi:hypothetical protein